VDSGAPEGLAVPTTLVIPVVFLLNDTDIIWYGNRVAYKYTLINTNSINKAWTPYTTRNGSKVERA